MESLPFLSDIKPSDVSCHKSARNAMMHPQTDDDKDELEYDSPTPTEEQVQCCHTLPHPICVIWHFVVIRMLLIDVGMNAPFSVTMNAPCCFIMS